MQAKRTLDFIFGYINQENIPIKRDWLVCWDGFGADFYGRKREGKISRWFAPLEFIDLVNRGHMPPLKDLQIIYKNTNSDFECLVLEYKEKTKTIK